MAQAIAALEALATSPIAEPLALMHLAQLQLLAGQSAGGRAGGGAAGSHGATGSSPKLMLAQACSGQAGRTRLCGRSTSAGTTVDR